MLPSISAAFVLGLLCGSFFPYVPILTSLCLVVILGVMSVGEITRGMSSRTGLALYGGVIAGVAYWHLFAWTMPAALVLPPQEEVTSRPFTGTIIEPIQHAPDRMTMVLQAVSLDESFGSRDHGIRLRLVWRNSGGPFYRGDRVTFHARVRPPHGSLNPRGFDYVAYLDRQGIDAVATVSGPDAIRLVSTGSRSVAWMVWNRVDRWREQVHVAAVETLDQPILGLFLGIIIGERGYLLPEVRDWFMATGTVHILSISGSHLGLVALLTYAVIRRGVLALPWRWILALTRYTTPTRLAAMSTLLPVTCYALLAGAETATMRSLIMIATALLALWLGYRRPLLHALSFAACVILIYDPRVLFDISFQLSFLSVWSMAWWFDQADTHDERSDTPPSWLHSVWRWGKASAAVTAVVTIVTLPLVAYYFNQIPWMGLLANFLVVPFTGLILVPLGLGCALWLITVQASTLPLAGLVHVFSTPLMDGVRMFASLPGVFLYVAAPTVPLMCAFYGATWISLTRYFSFCTRVGAMLAMSLTIGWWIWSPRPFVGDHMVRVTFLDVGQGDSTVVELPDGQVMLIDGGATHDRLDMGRGVVAPYLWNRGIRKIDHVVGSHPQLDHVGGLAWIVDHFPITHFWTNGLVREETFWKQLEASLEQANLAADVAREGMTMWAAADCEMRVLNPSQEMAAVYARRANVDAKELNNSSIVLVLTCGARSFLFAGDIERDGLSALLKRSDLRVISVMKVPHHGARSSLDPRWVDVTRPEVAVFSVGAFNPYRHPARDVVAAYRHVQGRIFRTDQDGAIWVDLDLSTSHLTVHQTDEWTLQPAPVSLPGIAIELENVRRMWRRWNWQ